MTYFPNKPPEEHVPAFHPEHSVLEEEDGYMLLPEEEDEDYFSEATQTPSLREEERELRRLKRRNDLRMAAGLGNFVAVIIGFVAILLLILVLTSLVTWLQSDLDHSFSLFLKHL